MNLTNKKLYLTVIENASTYPPVSPELKEIGIGRGIDVIDQYDGKVTLQANSVELLSPSSVMPSQLASGPENSVMMTQYGEVKWVPLEHAIGDLIKNPTIRDRIENLISAQKNLEMTIKLVQK